MRSVSARRRWISRAAPRRHPLDAQWPAPRAGATRCSCSVAIRSMRRGARSVSISSRRCRLISSSRGTLLLHPLDLVAVARAARSAARPRTGARRPGTAPMRHRPPQLPLARLVHLADDRVVANVLLDGVLEVHAPLMRTSQSRAAWRCGPAGCAPLPRPRGTSGCFVRIAQARRPPAPARGTCASRSGPRASET